MKLQKLTNLIIITFFLFAFAANAQDMRESLFGEIDKLVEKAQSSGIEYLSPGNYENAMKNYKEASEDFESGANLKDIKEMLAEVKTLLA